MLSSDEKIVDILLYEKYENNNKLLQYFHIGYPSNKIAQTSNSIYVACVDYESKEQVLGADKGRDLVDILITTKKKDNPHNSERQNYSESKTIIKTVMHEIRKLLRTDYATNKLGGTITVRNMTPEYTPNTYVLNRGHMLLQMDVIQDFGVYEDEVDCVCELLVGDIEYV